MERKKEQEWSDVTRDEGEAGRPTGRHGDSKRRGYHYANIHPFLKE